jgi:hypothetical protein
MGLLDEAIREHLELKRRRGADATEISRQESDALGPVRRSPEGVPDLSDLPPLEHADDAGHDAPPAPATPTPWEGETTVHTPPSDAVYEPPPLPPAAAAPPPAPAGYEPPPVPSVPAPAPPAADDPSAAAEEPPAEEPGHPSLLSRLNPTGRMRHSRREQEDEPLVPAAPPPEPAGEPPPEAYAPPPADEPDIVPADDEPEGEDLLEETPEFLEETPEHDRLWFEQRPPRDFNFDD